MVESGENGNIMGYDTFRCRHTYMANGRLKSPARPSHGGFCQGEIVGLTVKVGGYNLQEKFEDDAQNQRNLTFTNLWGFHDFSQKT